MSAAGACSGFRRSASLACVSVRIPVGTLAVGLGRAPSRARSLPSYTAQPRGRLHRGLRAHRDDHGFANTSARQGAHGLRRRMGCCLWLHRRPDRRGYDAHSGHCLAIAAIFLLTYLSSVLRPTILLVILVLSLLTWLGPARLVRGKTLSLRTRQFVEAVQMMGGRRTRIVRRHLIPGTLGTIVVSATSR